MRDRLIELLSGKSIDTQPDVEYVADYLLANGVVLVDTNTVDFVKNRKPIKTALSMPLDELSDLIRAKQDERIITPPCKVGDEVYFVCVDENCEDYIDKGKVYAISQNENQLWVSVRYFSGLRYDHTSGDFGETIFLTREEAEKALKGLQG